MVSTNYGAAHAHPDYDDAAGAGSEHSALLGAAATPSTRPQKEGHATILSSVSNLANTIIGSGMLSFALAMASCGIIPGVLLCIFSGSVGAFGLYLLSLCARRTAHRRSSFFAVSQLTYPRAATFFDAAIAIKCFGVSTSYLIIIKSLMPNVVASLYHDLTGPDTNPPDWTQSPRTWLLIFILLLAPLCFLRHLNSLRHTSYVAMFTVFYLVLIVVTCYFAPLKGQTPPGEIHYVHFSSSFVSTFPVQVFAFTCAQNLFPIYNELASNTQQRMNLIIASSIGGAALTYEVIAVFGYLTFGSKVTANIIEMYPATSLFIAVGQLAIVILVLFSYPLQVHPCRNCLDKVVFHHAPHEVKQNTNDEDDEAYDDDHASHEMSQARHVGLTTVIVLAGFAVAYFVDDLRLVLSFVGSTGSTTISLILPGLFYWKLTKDDPSTSRVLNRSAFALMLYGICIFVFCLSYNIYEVVKR
ncbi:vacuolar amino acid transporter 5 [Pterulicium gracile]|uniref:Vacuolar amino acid transporter 5 n=1 Tax=Pterulicium gracile TaxID=1884261 RepID=A0A5C3R3G8_9AGAR|nr:vacuolar amino acid transporter 5 [Pterula gracilis]